MPVGRGFTAARRRASRLAGLVQIPASCTAKTAIRRRASWLAEKASVDWISRWPFALRKNTSYAKAPHPAGVEYVPRQLRRGSAAIGSGGKKARPFCRRKKGEHERAPPLCVSYPAPLRATLRAPPSKWAIEAFFRRVSAANRGRGQPRRGSRRPKPATRSGAGRLWSRRAACFLWYYLSLRKKVLPPSGR